MLRSVVCFLGAAVVSAPLAMPVVAHAAPATAPAGAKPSKADPVAETVKALDLERFATAARNDADAYARYLADDLTYTHSSGVLDDKAKLLESLRSGKVKYQKLEPRDLAVRVYGSTAIVTGLAKVELLADGQEKKLEIRFTDVWAKRSGKWQMVSWHATKLP
jgi:ketosteroid isomerase-like protein